MQRDYNHALEGEVIQESEYQDGNNPVNAIAKLLENPAQLRGMLNLTPQQSQNMKALSVGIGAAAAVKYGGRYIGDVPAAAVGSILAALIAKKVFGV